MEKGKKGTSKKRKTAGDPAQQGSHRDHPGEETLSIPQKRQGGERTGQSEDGTCQDIIAYKCREKKT